MTELRSFDHVALWTDERPALAGFLLDRTGAHEIERTDDFTLIGADARRGKLTLFDASTTSRRRAGASAMPSSTSSARATAS
jgi:hypothetical protein